MKELTALRRYCIRTGDMDTANIIALYLWLEVPVIEDEIMG